MDASSKSNDDWQQIVNFVNNLAASFRIDRNCVRVAVISYADNAQAVITLGRYGDISSFQQAVTLQVTLLGGNSNLASGLQVLLNQVFATSLVRQGARLVAAIVTNRLTCNNQILSLAGQLRNRGVAMYGVAVTNQADVNCLSEVTSRQYVQVSTYRDLNNQVSRVATFACVSTGPGPAPTPAPACK